MRAVTVSAESKPRASGDDPSAWGNLAYLSM